MDHDVPDCIAGIMLTVKRADFRNADLMSDVRQ